MPIYTFFIVFIVMMALEIVPILKDKKGLFSALFESLFVAIVISIGVLVFTSE
jgi:hypothetical protein